MEIKDKKGRENHVADHLSRLTIDEVTTQGPEIQEEIPDEKLFNIAKRTWLAKMANFKAAGALPDDLTWHQKKKFLKDANYFVWDDPYLFKIGADNQLGDV